MTEIFKGNIIYTKTPNKFDIIENGYIVVANGKIQEVSDKLNEKFNGIEIHDFGNKLIIPGMNDLHLHAPQYRNMGIGLDKELLPWLNSYTFPEESKFSDLNYAKNTYKQLIRELWKQGTTRSVIFSSIHKNATKLLIDMFNDYGMSAFIGKVNMNRNSPHSLTEDTVQSLKDTEEIIKYCSTKSKLVRPIITPRFVPSCSQKLMDGLGKLAEKYSLPVQSHLSENADEIAWVKELHPESKSYGHVYDSFGLFGTTPTLMAHCIYSSKEEIELIKSKNVRIVHCPTSNMNIGSGIMPCRKYLDLKIPVCLGTDISGGSNLSMIKCIVYAIQLSKLYWIQSKKKYKFLSTSEAFYMATKAGGSFFGKVGSFEKSYSFDALIIDDSDLNSFDYSIEHRLERFLYTGDDRNIVYRYIEGSLVKDPNLL
ncbi:guanine deaminase [Clostridium tyrobutyricum]|uniref:guanine deaminase n=1 Tax=Clostridium tyrobutyricum TaxID=1519 RepID=UPI001C38A66F|nr:guanine deaminase [Clostridium tyrobutyricum]MBV4415584.1 guanine deaminase [Clostridium tyrobutyricum]